jgi:hypothetical protein
MQNNELDYSDYLTAQGPEGLRNLLDELLEKSAKDPAFAKGQHMIRYQLGNQQSLIKVDLSEKPYLFWYCDLLGRPITKAVQYTIADFLWEKGGEKERCLHELTVKEA